MFILKKKKIFVTVICSKKYQIIFDGLNVIVLIYETTIVISLVLLHFLVVKMIFKADHNSNQIINNKL